MFCQLYTKGSSWGSNVQLKTASDWPAFNTYVCTTRRRIDVEGTGNKKFVVATATQIGGTDIDSLSGCHRLQSMDVHSTGSLGKQNSRLDNGSDLHLETSG